MPKDSTLAETDKSRPCGLASTWRDLTFQPVDLMFLMKHQMGLQQPCEFVARQRLERAQHHIGAGDIIMKMIDPDRLPTGSNTGTPRR